MLGAVALAGCGSSSSGAPADPLDTSLSYFPSRSPFVITLATKPSAQAAAEQKALQRRLPLASFGKAAVLSKLRQFGIDFDKDIKPLYGNPVAFGDASPSLQGFQNDFLIVWVTKDASKLQALLKKLRGLQSAGKRDGATLYSTSGAAFAVTGPTIVFGKSVSDVSAALDRHAHGGGVTSAQYANAVSGLPLDASVHIFGDLTTALSTPPAAKARRVPWVAALRSYGVSTGYSAGGITFKFRLDTGGATLSPSQLPFATGSTPANVVAGLPIQAGIRNPSQIFSFAEAAERAASPQSYAKFLRQQATLRRKTGIDVNTLINQFQGDLVVDSDTHETLVRAGVGDPATVSQLLAKLAAAKGGLGNGSSLKPLGGGLYSFTTSGRSGLLTVTKNQLVFGIAPQGQQMKAATLKAFAAAPGAPITGASGAVSFRVAVDQLLALTIKQAPNPVVREVLGLLGDFSGSMTAAPGAITGTAVLALK
jgi:hypothetical protein